MKKNLFLLIVMPLLMACQSNEPIRKIAGEYTYYISGNVRWWGEGHNGEYSALEPEKGKLVISEEKGGTYIATFYTENGDFFNCEAGADEEEIFLTQGYRNLTIDSIKCSAIVSSQSSLFTSRGFSGYIIYQGNPLGDYTQKFVSNQVAITATRNELID